jgi:hypothetical protein
LLILCFPSNFDPSQLTDILDTQFKALSNRENVVVVTKKSHVKYALMIIVILSIIIAMCLGLRAGASPPKSIDLPYTPKAMNRRKSQVENNIRKTMLSSAAAFRKKPKRTHNKRF